MRQDSTHPRNDRQDSRRQWNNDDQNKTLRAYEAL